MSAPTSASLSLLFVLNYPGKAKTGSDYEFVVGLRAFHSKDDAEFARSVCDSLEVSIAEVNAIVSQADFWDLVGFGENDGVQLPRCRLGALY